MTCPEAQEISQIMSCQQLSPPTQPGCRSVHLLPRRLPLWQCQPGSALFAELGWTLGPQDSMARLSMSYTHTHTHTHTHTPLSLCWSLSWKRHLHSFIETQVSSVNSFFHHPPPTIWEQRAWARTVSINPESGRLSPPPLWPPLTTSPLATSHHLPSGHLELRLPSAGTASSQ